MAAMNVLTEDVIALSDVPKFLPKVEGRGRPSICTIWRWAMRGVGGTKLESIKIGSQNVTSKQAVTRFIEKTSSSSQRSA